MLQETPAHPVLQHDAVHFQHAHDAQGESQHALLFPDATRHVGIRRETSYARTVSG